MPRARRCLLAVLLVAVGACGGPPSTGPLGSSAAGPSGPTGEGIQAVKDGLSALVIPPTDGTDLLVDRLTTALDLRGALGDQADAILTLMAQADRAAYAGLPEVTPPAATIVTASYRTAVPTPPKAPPPTTELMLALPGSLDSVGRLGPGTNHSGPDTATATERGEGLTASSTMTTTIDVAITGSALELKIVRTVDSKVVEDASGTSALSASEKYTVVGRMDVCPTAAGISIGGLDQSITLDATTKAGALGRVGTHSVASITSSSKFQGQVDDSATLGNVTQDYTHDEQWKRTAAAEGGPESKREGDLHVGYTGIGAGVPSAHEFSPGLGDFSKVDGSVEATGDVTQQMINSTAISAGWDFATIDQAYVAAQKLWQNSRCVMVAVPQYDTADNVVQSELEVSLQGFQAHTEDVEKGSTTPFEAILRHRFGQDISATIEATLNGKKDLTPTSIGSPPGTLTYTAPDEKSSKASVRMTSTSKQGIGILVIGFDTEAGKGLTGTLTLVEDWQNGTDWSKRKLTVNVRLQPAPGYDGITGAFDDSGSTYSYEGSSFKHSESDPSCFIEMNWASTGSGAFGSEGRVIGLGIDESGEADLTLDVRFSTKYSVTTVCYGGSQTTTNTDDQDGWQPYCGFSPAYLQGKVDAKGTVDFTCTSPIQPGLGSLTVSGALTRK